MSSDIKVAIVMPAYNASKTILKAINSVVNQSYKKWVLYIIDDASTDDTSDIVKSNFTDKRIKYLKNEENKGVSFSRNRALNSMNDEDIITFLDSDDSWERDKLLQQIIYFQKGERLIFSSYTYITSDTERSITYPEKYIERNDFLLKKFRVCFSSVFFKRDNVTSKLRFLPNGHEDFIFLNELFLIFERAYICEERLVNYHVESGSLSSNKYKSIRWHWGLLLIIFKGNYLKAIFYFISYAYRGWVFDRRK